MKDIGERAGVHQTTVSLALRNHPSISAKTREKVRRVAEEMGYRPDPMLTSLIAYRKNNYLKTLSPTIAYIMNLNGPEGLKESPVRQLFLKGAEKRAQELGYKIEVFYYGGRHYRSKHLDKVLMTRNIKGVILGGFYTNYTDIELSWNCYSVVKIEALPRRIRAHTIGNNQYHTTRLAFRKLREMGFRRIGLCVAQHDEKHTDNLFSAGYFVEENSIPINERVPLLIFDANEFVTDLGMSEPVITDWLVENEVEACISNWGILNQSLEAASEKLGRNVYGISLDVIHPNEDAWGVKQNHEIVGAAGVEVVTGLMQNNQTGLTDFPRMNLVDGYWKDPPLDTVEQIKAELNSLQVYI